MSGEGDDEGDDGGDDWGDDDGNDEGDDEGDDGFDDWGDDELDDEFDDDGDDGVAGAVEADGAPSTRMSHASPPEPSHSYARTNPFFAPPVAKSRRPLASDWFVAFRWSVMVHAAAADPDAQHVFDSATAVRFTGASGSITVEPSIEISAVASM